MSAVSIGGVEDTAPRSGEPLAGIADVARRFSGVPQNGAVLGAPRAPVTVVEFADLQCPFCAQWDRDVLPALLKRVRRGEVRLVLRPLRFLGPDSVKAAALAGAAAGQDRLWQVVDLFYRNQGAENSGYVTEAFQRRLAAAAPGLDVTSALAARSTPAAARLAETAEREATAAGVQSTPSFLAGRTGRPLKLLDTVSFDPDEFLATLDLAAKR
jgi:protein-disulfide isomerase